MLPFLSHTLDRLQRGALPHPLSGKAIEPPVKHIALFDSVADPLPFLLKKLAAGTRPLIVCDRNTHEALGKKVAGTLNAAPLILEGSVQAETLYASIIRNQIGSHDYLVAIGGGVINDLCKHVAHQANLPYVCLPTAPSMNGYASANASITVNGYKQTLPARPPAAIFVDLTVCAHAPQRLIRAGLGDSACRATAQCDWLLSRFVLDTPYDETPFLLLKDSEPDLLAHAAGLVEQDRRSVQLLMETLILSGIGMTLCGGSYPASQGEHLIAHFMEMYAGHGDVLHGETIAVTTLTMADIQENLLTRDAVRFAALVIPEAEIKRHYSPHDADTMLRALAEKRPSDAQLKRLNAHWREWCQPLKAATLPKETLTAALTNARAPLEPQAIGWNEKDYAIAVREARFLRNRFTFLDLVAMCEGESGSWSLESGRF